MIQNILTQDKFLRRVAQVLESCCKNCSLVEHALSDVARCETKSWDQVIVELQALDRLKQQLEDIKMVMISASTQIDQNAKIDLEIFLKDIKLESVASTLLGCVDLGSSQNEVDLF
ncbi:MAG: hypothetical protein AAGF71_05510 [Pseudomonadota bacterium]